MTQKYICSDLHLGHANIERFRPRKRFPGGEIIGSEEQHELNLEQLKLLNKREVCYLLGDVVFTLPWLERLKEVRCRLILVGGNHDLPLDVIVKSGVFEKVYGLELHKKHWLSHAPIHPQELRGRNNVHGHTHHALVLGESGMPDSRYRNVSLEYTGYKPVKWEHAISEDYYYHCVHHWQLYKNEGRLA
jgi:calcineurin-like phosphoesterase family protein